VAREIQSFAVSIPAGTLKSAPQITALTMPPRIVDEVEILVPPGPRGEVGFQLGAAGGQIIPVTLGQFIVTDNEVIHWPMEDQIDSGAWQLIAYNTGSQPHTVTVRFLARLPLPPGQLVGLVPLPAQDISPGFALAPALTV
jgi:hypothetical protein